MKTIHALLFFHFFCTSLVAQNPADSKRDYFWIFGNNFTGKPSEKSIIDFNQAPIISESLTSALEFGATNTSQCDSLGNLLFYTNGRRLFNRQHQLMENGDSLSEWDDLTTVFQKYPTVNQGVLALPFPGNENHFYLFHGPLVWSYDEFVIKNPALLLSIIDMEAANGDGKVISKNEIIVEQRLNYGTITATRHANGRDWWVIVPGFNSADYLKFLLDSSGLHYFETQNIGEAIPYGFGQAAFSPDGSKYARVDGYNEEHPDSMIIFDFDRCAGMLSNPIFTTKFDSSGYVGVAISPNSRFLYWTSNRYVYQYDLLSPNVLASKLLVAETLPFTPRFALAQLAPDGKIYINSPGSSKSLHVIEQPNMQGVTCSVCQQCLELPHENRRSLPNFPNYRLGPLDGSPCDTLGLDVATGEKVQAGNVMKIYPNPADGEIVVEFGSGTKATGLSIINAQGVEVGRYAVSGQGQINLQIPTHHLQKGMYNCILLSNGQAIGHTKFVIWR